MRELKNVTIEITSKCNFACKHCGNDSSINNSNQLTKEEVYSLIDQMQKMGVERLSISGGEPFIDPNIFNYLSYAKDKIPTIAIATNGYFINEEIVERLNELGVRKFAISLDGLADYHNSFRAHPEAYDRALNAIILLVSSGMEVKVRTVLTKENEEDIFKLMEVTNALEVKRHEILPVCPIGRASKQMMLSSDEYKEFVIKALAKIKTLTNPITYQLKPVFYQKQLFKDAPIDTREKSLSYTCDAFDTSLEIASDGTVYGCSFVRLPAGNIRHDALKNIWQGSLAEELHDQIMNQNTKGECRDCENNNKCNGGCYANYLEKSKDSYCFVKKRRSNNV